MLQDSETLDRQSTFNPDARGSIAMRMQKRVASSKDEAAQKAAEDEAAQKAAEEASQKLAEKEAAKANAAEVIWYISCEEPLASCCYAMSFGTACWVSWNMLKHGYKKATGPFDTTLMTDAMVNEIVSDDFAKYLDVQQLHMKKVKSDKGWSHSLYDKHYDDQRILLKHHSPRDWQQGIMQERVQRMRDLMATPHPVLFVMGGWKRTLQKERLPPLVKSMQDNGGHNFIILAINLIEDGTSSYDYHHIKCSDTEEIIWVNFHVIQKPKGLSFKEHQDQKMLRQIFGLVRIEWKEDLLKTRAEKRLQEEKARKDREALLNSAPSEARKVQEETARKDRVQNPELEERRRRLTSQGDALPCFIIF